MKYGQIWMKKYAEQSEAKKKPRTIKRGPKKLNFGASKPGVGGGPGPLGPPTGSASGIQLYFCLLAVWRLHGIWIRQWHWRSPWPEFILGCIEKRCVRVAFALSYASQTQCWTNSWTILYKKIRLIVICCIMLKAIPAYLRRPVLMHEVGEWFFGTWLTY